MAGTVGMAVLWTLGAAAALLAWPCVPGWLARRRPGWVAPWAPPPAAIVAAWRRLASPGPSVLVAWTALVVVLAVVPWGGRLMAADLDAGLLWVLALAILGWAVVAGRGPGAAGAVGASRAAGAAGAVFALVGAVAPVVMRAATLNLADIAVAQQGGAGNWFLVREPFLLGAGIVYLLTVACAWSPAADRADGEVDPWRLALAWGWPLAASLLFSVVYLGGWWAFVPTLDGWPWLNTALKALAVLGVLLSLARRPVLSTHLLRGFLPLVALLMAAGSLAWLVIGGGVR